MARLSVVLLLALTVVYATAQFNYRCSRTPNQWRGDAFFVDYDTKNVFFAEISYNSIQRTVYQRVYERNEDSRTLVEEWYEFSTETKYNRTFGGECRSFTISRPFEPFRVPSDANFEGRSTFGASLPVDMFSGSFSDGGRYYVFWSPLEETRDIECIPVIESYVREGPSTPLSDRRNVHITYTNFTTSFESPPAPCVPRIIHGLL